MNAPVVTAQSNKNQNKQKEWPYFKTQSKDFADKTVPLLIMEIHRLQPIYASENARLQVHNMSDLRICNAAIIGTIFKVFSRTRLDMHVDDGTGKIQVLCSWELLNKLKDDRKNIDAKYQRLEKVAKIKKADQDHMKDLEKQWKLETKNGTLGNEFNVLDYVHVTGFIHPDFGNFFPKKEISLENGKLCKPIIFAKTIYHISEKEYNDGMQELLSRIVKKRYQAN